MVCHFLPPSHGHVVEGTPGSGHLYPGAPATNVAAASGRFDECPFLSSRTVSNVSVAGCGGCCGDTFERAGHKSIVL